MSAGLTGLDDDDDDNNNKGGRTHASQLCFKEQTKTGEKLTNHPAR